MSGSLSETHRRELEAASAIDPAVIAERGYRTVTRHGRDDRAALGVTLRSDSSYPALLLPMFRPTGEAISVQVKPAEPITIKGRPVKYLSPRGQANRLDVHPRNAGRIRDVSVPLWITEGIKKGDSLTSRGCCVVTLTGVYNWRERAGTLGDWEDVPMKGREIILCFDADAKTNMNVARALVRLGRWCRAKGAARVQYLIVPREVQGRPTKGADDYLAAGGTLVDLLAAATTTEPDTEVADDTFSDSRLAERIADEVLADRFVWCKALGWYAWTGQRWHGVTEETVGEAIRQYCLERFTEAARTGRKAQTAGWQSMLGVGRQRAVLTLARGIVEVRADSFDADPDLLNTPTGIVDLRTAQVLPHDPEHLITKITRGNYRAGYEHADWQQALTALPDDEVRAWFQVRIGQAITGHPTPDGVNVILQGSGENSKSVITTDGCLPALGDYAAPASPKLITAKDEHATERADLRGQRLLVAEELTEDRALNVTAIKQITDVSIIKARYVHRDNFTFVASHSFFITTNYLPTVSETDHGTWRRLALLRFPYTYRKPGEALTAPTDRRGDPRLKARIRSGASGQHDAIVTWAIEGARRWYAEGFPPLPARVEADTRAWRTQADRILGFWDECLIADPAACVLTSELWAHFNAWLATNGHHVWSKELFHPRFRSHVETVHRRVEERRTTKLNGLSRPPGAAWAEIPQQAYVYVGVRFRAHAEMHEIIEETRDFAEVADPKGNSPIEGHSEEFPQGSARPANHVERHTEVVRL